MSIGLQLWGVRSVGASRDEFRAILRFVIPNVLATAFLIAGGLLEGGGRKVLWAIFVVAVVRGIVVARFGNRSVRPGHFAERHGLIVIIALGEIIVAIGVSVVNSLDDAAGLSGDTLIGLCAAGGLAGLLWWGYFDRVGPALEYRGASLDGREQSALVADVYTGLHMPVVAGIIAAAAATEEILLHPARPVPTAFLLMFVAGIVLFYGGVSLAAHRAFRVLAWERLFAIAVVTLLAIVGRSWDGIVLLLAVDAALIVGIVGEHVRIGPHANPSALPHGG